MTASAERGLRAERVAEVVVALPGERAGRRGSGYLVAPGRVLTAAHVVEGAVGVRVRFDADRPGERTVEAAVEWRHAGVDAAVLTLPGDTEADAVQPVSYGRVGDADAVLRCTTLGFPRFKLRTDDDGSRFRDAEHVEATCAVLSNRREGTLDLKVASPPAEDPDPDRDAWEGMSGAAVFSNGRLVGVVTRHHRTDGPGRIAASRVDRWAEVLGTAELDALEQLVGSELSPAALPDAVPLPTLDLIQEVYRAQLTDIAPVGLRDRGAELDDLVAFCGGPDQYLWLQGSPWAGKTALAAWFALHAPRGVVPVWFFITARYASQSDGNAFTGALIDQLAVLAGREPSGNSSPTARDGERRLLLREAAERVAQSGGTLLLVVDGLDEDQSRIPGGTGTSIASLLPEKLPPNVRVLVTSRPSPGLPADVGGGHPLRHCKVVTLTATAAARHTEYEAKFDLEQALSGDRLQRDLVGLLTAARGTLTVDDLRELTGEPAYELRKRLGSTFGRILRLGGYERSADGDVTLYMSSRGYLFAHETLLVTAQHELGPDIAGYLERLHSWAETYERRGWPENTPPYLLQPYGRLLTFLREANRAVALATDVRRRDRLREVTGSDAACLAEIATAREAVRRVAPDDLGSLAALAAAGDLVARRNASLHPDIPAVYARLGRTRHAIGLARSVFRPRDRARALGGVARVLAEAGDRRAVGLAEQALPLADEAAAEEGTHVPPSPYVQAAHGTLATVLALVGREDEAVSLIRGLPHPPQRAKAAVGVLCMVADALRNPPRRAELLRLAQQLAEDFPLLPDRVRLLATVAEAWSAGGFPEEAGQLHDRVAEIARCHPSTPEFLPALAAEALRRARPRDAELLASLSAAELDRREDASMGTTAYGAVHALVALDRTEDAHRLAATVRRTSHLRESAMHWRRLWQVIAESWARQGDVSKVREALVESTRSAVYPGDELDGLARNVRLLAQVGAADQAKALLTAGEFPAWEVAGGLTALAGHFAADDPQRALRLLREAEHGQHTAALGFSFPRQDRIAALAGALAATGLTDEAERLLAAITNVLEHIWGCAVVSRAVARSDTATALRLAAEVIDRTSTMDQHFEYQEPLVTAVAALGWAGGTERLAEIVEEHSGGVGRTLGRYELNRARAEAAVGLRVRFPDVARRLVDDALRDTRHATAWEIAAFLTAVERDDTERATRIRRFLEHRVANPGRPLQASLDRVLLALLIGAADPMTVRHRLDSVVTEQGSSLRFYSSPELVALAYAVLGDYETARTVARLGKDEESYSRGLAHLAAYAACVPAECVAMPLAELARPRDDLPTARRLATFLRPPPSGPDLPGARSLLAEALTPDGWHHAVPVLAAIDPDAVLRVRDVVFAHLGISD